ncbi:MAG: RluA family pseudouridine synthase [bacterium]|nr:RluA family pseudouridine synthase [bacterium]
MNLIVLSEESDQRLDKFLLFHLPSSISRSYLQKIVKDGCVKANNLPAKPSYKVREGDCIFIELPERKSLQVNAENITLNIIFEDEDIIVVNKKAGMITHPTFNILNNTLINALLFHCGKLSHIGAPMRPGIVHRLDKNTSGVIVVAKNDQSYLSLVGQIQERTMEKRYKTIVYGNIREDFGKIDMPIGRHPHEGLKMAVLGRNYKEAKTSFKVVERFFLPKYQFSLLEVKLESGRTHQIRVHLSHIKHPLVGDEIYGPKSKSSFINRQALHAEYLKLSHPRNKKEMEFYAPLPEDMKEFLDYLKRDNKSYE